MSRTDDFKKLEDLVKSVYLVKDPGIIRLLCASVIAHRIPSKPVWVFIVSPSSGGKTEFITALSKIEGIYPLSALTPHTFISGQKKQGKETSLLNRLQNGILTFKDFTSILSAQRDARDEIMGQLREIYDGEYRKEFGTGETHSWVGKISMIAGVTTTIYTAREMYAAMGERFVMYQLIQPDRFDVSKRAIENAEDDPGDERKIIIKDAFKGFIEGISIPKSVPKMSEELKIELIELSELSTRARSPIDRDWRSSTKEMTFVHDPEMPTRFATQLITIGRGLMVLDDTDQLIPESKNILYKIALDSISKTRRLVLQELTKYTSSDTASIATKLNYPTNSVRRWLEDLNALEMVDRSKGGNKDTWTLKNKYREILSKFEHIPMLKMSAEDEPEPEPVITPEAQQTIQMAQDMFGLDSEDPA